MNIKKFALVLGLAATMATSVSAATKVYVDNTEIKFDSEPSIVDGRVMVPVRAVFEKAGADVFWDEETRVTTLTCEGYEVQIKEGDPFLIKNGTPVALDVPAMIINDRLAIPVRAISEAMDLGVTWNSIYSSVLISTNGKEYRPTVGWRTGFLSLKEAGFLSENSLSDVEFFDFDGDRGIDPLAFIPVTTNPNGTKNAPALWISGVCYNDVLNKEYEPYAIAVADLVSTDKNTELIVLYNSDMGRCAGVYRYDADGVSQIKANNTEDGMIYFNNTLYIDGSDNIISDMDGLTFVECMLNTGVYTVEDSELTRYQLSVDKALDKNWVRKYTDNLPYTFRYVNDYEKGSYVGSAEGDDIIYSNDIAGFKLIDSYTNRLDPSMYEFYIELPDGKRMVIWPYNV